MPVTFILAPVTLALVILAQVILTGIIFFAGYISTDYFGKECFDAVFYARDGHFSACHFVVSGFGTCYFDLDYRLQRAHASIHLRQLRLS